MQFTQRLSATLICLSAETAMFVEKLFRCLETESYMKGEDPPKTPPIHLTSSSSASSCVAMPAKIVEKQMNDRMQSSAPSKADNGERRPSEDFRRKEVFWMGRLAMVSYYLIFIILIYSHDYDIHESVLIAIDGIHEFELMLFIC